MTKKLSWPCNFFIFLNNKIVKLFFSALFVSAISKTVVFVLKRNISVLPVYKSAVSGEIL